LRDEASVKRYPIDHFRVRPPPTQPIPTLRTAADKRASNLVQDDVCPNASEIDCSLCDQAGTMAWRPDVPVLLEECDIKPSRGKIAGNSAPGWPGANDDGVEHPMRHRSSLLRPIGQLGSLLVAPYHTQPMLAPWCVLSPIWY
jgi:hypothetical protein